MSLPKTVQLGVIVLALGLLRKWKLGTPRTVSAVAARFGVSRKTGYEAARRIVRQLSGEAETGDGGKHQRENAILSIRLQVVTYERDHRGVSFRDRSAHLPREAKGLSVRILRDFRDRLSLQEIAETIGVPESSLRRWDGEADERGALPAKDDDRRGKSRHASAEDEARVLEAWEKLQKPTSIAQFAEEYRSDHPDRPLDPKTIGRILKKHGLKPLRAKKRTKPYHDKVEIYFPGAQAAVDASKCTVRFVGGREETVVRTEEVALDLASGAILGKALRREEDAEGVERVVVEARAECEKLLSVLSDNGSANASVRRVVDESTDVGAIVTFPASPKTNGLVEGLFGQFKRIVEEIEIDDSSRESIAESVVETVWRIYGHFHNYSPRRRLQGLSPIEYLRRYAPLPDEVEAARQGLRRRRERSEALRAPHPRLHDEGFRGLVERILVEHRFEVDLDRAIRSLLPFDKQVIESASRAFFVASSRDGFHETKRTFAYFMGIVSNKQREVDEARLRDRLGRDQSRRIRDQNLHDARKREEERLQHSEDLKERPERVILSAAKLLLSGELRLMRKTLITELREGLQALDRLSRNTPRQIELLAVEIRSWGKYREKVKAKMLELLEREAATIRRTDCLAPHVPGG